MPAKTMMIQGVASHVGKSLMTAALCRILLQDGIRVAPFKSQNMALNAAVTDDGLEIGRAQALQAQACRIPPDVRMNPILLKPQSDGESQVVCQGRVYGVLSARDYYREARNVFWPVIQQAYASLAAEYDVVVIEGAGSPAEINLMDREMVNMRVAEMADAPVLLVGDIDRGGVFASLVGTLSLLPEPQARRIQGFLINKFRGDAALLEPGLEALVHLTGRPVLGVVPFLRDLHLPEEDSVGFSEDTGAGREGLQNPGENSHRLTLAVVDLPCISNFTDLDPFYLEPDVDVRVVQPGGSLGQPDALILLGSKAVAADLAVLRESRLAEAVEAYVASGGMVVGLCGGFQMMGQWLEDPHGLEGPRGRVRGLGILDVETVLALEKILRRVEADHLESGLPVQGYEIHHGRTTVCQNSRYALRVSNGTWDGASNGRCWGTYLHGVFDADSFRRWFLDRLWELRGWDPMGRVHARYDVNPMLDRLAETVRRHVDVRQVYQILGL